MSGAGSGSPDVAQPEPRRRCCQRFRKRLKEKTAHADLDRGSAPGDGAAPATRVYTYRRGPLTYVGFVQDYRLAKAEKTEATLDVRTPGEVYDVLAGKRLGRSGRFPVTLRPSDPHLYAVLPYQVKGLRLSAPGRAKPGGALAFQAKVDVNTGRAAEHVVVVRLKRPDGSSREWDRFTLLAPDGEARGTCAFALDDPPGQWTLTVKDAATGASASRRFVLETGGQP